MENIKRAACKVFVCLSIFGGMTGTARAYLGSFEELDGYRVPVNGQITSLNLGGDAQFYLNNDIDSGFTGVVAPGAYPNTLGDGTHGADVSRYNAGQYGTTNGGPGGVAVDILDNSGLWQAIAGGRLQEDLDAPFYYGTTRNYVAAYRVGGAHTGNQVLNLYGSDTSLAYQYSFDSRDFDGVNPTTTVSSIVEMSFWLCPTDWDDDYTGHMLGLGLRDANGMTLLEVGYTGDNFFQYRMPGGEWQTTGYNVGSQGWSQVSVAVDTASDWVSLGVSAFDDNTFTLGVQTSIFDTAPIGLDAGALAGLDWDLEGGSLPPPSVSFKNYFDDFSFTVTPVPEPAGAMLAVFGLVWLGARRRR